MTKKNDRIVIWPVYIDSEKTRGEGRAISKRDAVRNPSTDRIMLAALEMKLDPIAERDKCHPKKWWEKNGRVLVLKKGPKTALMREIASRIKSKGC
ncbi:MAG: signal recognition particle subunit SRP19/SEC65 family protein [Methanotrichaceae archaeon]